MRERKPIPKNQSQITQESLNPAYYQSKPDSSTVFTHNRALEMSRKTDKIKDISIGLEDIDYALKYYFENVIKPVVTQDGNLIPVPVKLLQASVPVKVGLFNEALDAKSLTKFVI